MIPSEDKIRRALLMELYAANQNHAATPKYCYDMLIDYFEDDLTDEDLAGPYKNSRSRWANTIQVTRNHLIRDGYILSPEQHIRGEWKLTNIGVKLGRELYVSAYEEDPWANNEININNISDIIVEKFQDKDEEEAFPEGKEKYRLHHSKERNAKLVALKKKNAIDKNPLLPCEICQISFKEVYGEIGDGFIEAHHITPISDLEEETETKLEDLILVCSNCHKIIHRRRPWLTIEQIKELLSKNNEGCS